MRASKLKAVIASFHAIDFLDGDELKACRFDSYCSLRLNRSLFPTLNRRRTENVQSHKIAKTQILIISDAANDHSVRLHPLKNGERLYRVR